MYHVHLYTEYYVMEHSTGVLIHISDVPYVILSVKLL